MCPFLHLDNPTEQFLTENRVAPRLPSQSAGFIFRCLPARFARKNSKRFFWKFRKFPNIFSKIPKHFQRIPKNSKKNPRHYSVVLGDTSKFGQLVLGDPTGHFWPKFGACRVFCGSFGASCLCLPGRFAPVRALRARWKCWNFLAVQKKHVSLFFFLGSLRVPEATVVPSMASSWEKQL